MNRIGPLRSILSACLVVALLSGVWSIAAPSGYPTRTDPYVNDFASLLTADHTASLRSLFSELKTDNGVEIVVVTIASIHDYATGDASIEAFATNLFNTWGVGTAQKNDGVLILTAWKDREVRIEVGAGFGDSLNADMQTIIDEQMIPAFRNENYSQGVYDGARAVSRRLVTRLNQATVPQTAPEQVEAAAETSAPPQPNIGNIVLIGGGLLGGAVAAAVGAEQYVRYRRRRCPNCQTDMIRLDEVSDDVHLDSGQKVEELLESVNYDVWKCPACNFHTLQGYQRWTSRYETCPQCNYRTCTTKAETIDLPSYTSSGTKLITRDCRHCKHHDEDRITLPMLIPSEEPDDTDSDGHSSSRSFWSGSRSSSHRSSSSSHSWSSSRSSSNSRSSSSSRSSSGGRSRGGGASGKW